MQSRRLCDNINNKLFFTYHTEIKNYFYIQSSEIKQLCGGKNFHLTHRLPRIGKRFSRHDTHQKMR